MQKKFKIEWMTFNGNWRVVASFATRAAASKAFRANGLFGNPAYRIREH